MNVQSDDRALRNTAILNLAVESAVAVVSAVLFYQQISGGNLAEKLEAKFKEWRVKFFGPPPPTEEQIQHMEKLVHIEAMRIVREGK